MAAGEVVSSSTHPIFDQFMYRAVHLPEFRRLVLRHRACWGGRETGLVIMGAKIVYRLVGTPRHRTARPWHAHRCSHSHTQTPSPTMSAIPDTTTAPPPTSLVLTPQLMVIQPHVYPILESHIAYPSDEAEARKSIQGRGGAAAAANATVTGHSSIAFAQRWPETHHGDQLRR